MSHKEVNGKLMLSIYVRPELVTVLSNEDADAKEARTRFGRVLYTGLRCFISEYKELEFAVKHDFNSDDDLIEMKVNLRRIDLYREMLQLLGFDPYCDPERGWKGLKL